MSNETLPGWLAPLVGMALGAGLALTAVGIESAHALSAPLVGGGIGLGAGLLIWLIDVARRRPAQLREQYDEDEEDDEERPRRRRRRRSRRYEDED